MKTESTQIGNTKVLKLIDTQEKNDVFKHMQHMWDPKKVNEFPGPQPISIERRHFQELLSREYYASNKTDGERFVVCMTKYMDQYISFILSRNLDIFLFKSTCTKNAYNGTIIDCELIGDNFQVFDCILWGGSNVKTSGFSERLSACETVCSYIKDSNFNFKVKKFVPLAQSAELASETFKSDGYIFMPENKPIMQGTHSSLFKWKPLYSNTIDFGVQNGKVYLQNSGKLIAVNISLDTKDITFNTDDLVIVESSFIKQKHWKALHIRSDKNLPNSHYTYKKTLINIDENIQVDEIFNLQ